jgi:hypothetical protein
MLNRGDGYQSVFLVFDRESDSFEIVFDANDDGQPSASDPVIHTVEFDE